MIQPWGFDTFADGLRAGVEIYHALKKVLHKNKTEHRRRRRGRLRAGPEGQRGRAEGHRRGRRQRPATSSASRSSSPSTPPPASCGTSEKKGYKFFKSNPDKILSQRADGRLLDQVDREVPDPLASKTAWPRTTGTAGRSSPTASATRSSSSATTCSSPTSKFLEKGIKHQDRQRDPGEGQPDRHAQRDVRRREPGDAQRLHRRPLAPLAARPKTRRSPTSPSRPTAARSRPAPRRAATASPSTTSSSASKSSSATRAEYGGEVLEQMRRP